MKLLTLILTSLLSTSLLASEKGYKLDMELSMNGKAVSSPKLTIREGETGTITSETAETKSSFEVVATEGEVKGAKGILMKFKVSHLNKDGSKEIISKPTILSKNGEEATVAIGEQGKKAEMVLKVVATRKIL